MIENINQTSTPTISQLTDPYNERNINATEQDLIDACDKMPYLDGQYFAVVLEKSKKTDKISARCTSCDQVVIGSLKVSSNYVLHLKVSFVFDLPFKS